MQTVAILVSPANHLDKADLYFTMLGTAIRSVRIIIWSGVGTHSVRIAQALNLHRLGPGKPEGKVSIAREVRKRVWHQLVIQGEFCVTRCAVAALVSLAESPRLVPCRIQRYQLYVDPTLTVTTVLSMADELQPYMHGRQTPLYLGI